MYSFFLNNFDSDWMINAHIW